MIITKIPRNISETVKETYNYYKEGKSIQQITKLRGLTESTIYYHFESLILNKLVGLNEIVNPVKKEKILDVLKEKDLENLSEIKDQLDESISYGEIRCVLAFVKLQNNNNLTHLANQEIKKRKSIFEKSNDTQKDIVKNKQKYQPIENKNILDSTNLLSKLKKWRKDIASEKNIPSYFIFSNSTLINIINQLPKTKEELYEIKGVGNKKIESYGKEILKIVNGDDSFNMFEIEETNISEKLQEQVKILESQKKEIFTVGKLTKYIKNILESDRRLTDLLVRGEISNLTRHNSGHTYFSLKDEESQIRCILFRRVGENLKFNLEHGMKVIVRGNMEVYKPRGEYSIIIEEIQPDGLGSLNLAFVQLKEKLKKEGLFLDRYKKILPKFPKTIGIITSPTGAVIQDIINIIKKRYPLVKILIAPTLVQGEEATNSIIKSIKLMNEFSDVDSIILGRGGGSLEDLWCFNEERVARAIFESEIPIISAVGHETDFTIADLVADYRAPTSSSAAEKIVPDINEVYEHIEHLKIRSAKSLYHQLRLYKSILKQIMNRFVFKKPLEIVHSNCRELDQIAYQLQNSIVRIIETRKKDLEIIESKITALSPKIMLESYKLDLIRIMNRPFFKKPHKITLYNRRELDQNTYKLQNSIKRIIDIKRKDLEIIESKIVSLNPMAILGRGYSIVMNKNKILINSSDVKKGEDINIILHGGKIDAKVKKIWSS